jgi:prepilin-type N-terminal cleavage/methylation domain-containing protein
MKFFRDQRGYSLIEIIVVIVVLGILMSVGLFARQRAMDGDSLAQASATSTQKAQIALDRITIELSHITYNSSLGRYNISVGTGTSITYIANFGGSDETHTIDQNTSQVRFDTDNTKPLTDGVVSNGLQFTYFDGNGNSVAATSLDMRLIGIALTVQVTSTASRTFNARVALQQ